ncbi:MAG: carboxylesterase [Ignavibacteria bacterium]|nr:carboxylesterase [Ignavibacteria bacterium]
MKSPLHHIFGSFDRKPSTLHPAIILLHGRGADEEDLLGLVPYLDKRLLAVAVRAPYRFPFAGYTWYDVQEVGAPDPEEFQHSYEALLEFVEHFKRNHPVDPEHLFLFGFSMGAVMSFALSLSHPEMVRGTIAHSGYIPEQNNLEIRWDALGSLGVFVAHGIHDPVISIDHARRAKERLSRTSVRLTYREYPMAHQISEASLGDFTRWLSGELDGTSSG